MPRFATYGEQEGDRRTSVRIEQDGTVMVLVTGLHGEVIHNLERTIEPARAAGLVEEVAAIVPDLSEGSGRASVGFGHGAGQPAVWQFDPDQAPPDLTNIGARMRRITDELLAGQRAHTARSVSATPRRTAGLTVSAFLGWTGIYFGGHILSAVVGLVGLYLGARFLSGGDDIGAGLSLLLVVGGLGGMLLLIGMTYFFIGRAQGRRYGDVSAVWQCALAAVFIPAVVSGLMGGGFTFSGITFTFPILARLGAYTVTDA